MLKKLKFVGVENTIILTNLNLNCLVSFMLLSQGKGLFCPGAASP